MRSIRTLCVVGLILFASVPSTWADDATPIPQPTSAPVEQPTAAPIVTVAPAPQPTTAPEGPPLTVAPETGPRTGVTQAPAVAPTQPPADLGRPITLPGTAMQPSSGQPTAKHAPGNTSVSGNPVVQSALTGSTLDSTTLGSTIIDPGSQSVSAAAPEQLHCTGKSKPIADPFMVSPYAGWADINSFVDHDSPDYSLDGKIVIANGLTASSSSGAAADFFPSYWSDSLRQYISYDGHNGYDFGISYQPVLAAASGTVSFAGWSGSSQYDGYGQMVLINHHNGYTTLYGHLSELKVQTGDKVRAGEEIGISGNTGRSSGPHLHFSVFHNCHVTDPYGWTGQGSDPLTAFNGERASYVWLPGQDPLALNPPPQWPAYPAGMKVGVPQSDGTRRIGRRIVPPADRLLLLRLPTVAAGVPVGPAVALARAEARSTQEGEDLVPYLQDLQAQNLISTYQLIPAAAAIWIRGTAGADQLQGLPGIASLTGAHPRDLVAAQVGLAHGVLSQIDRRQAPSLWPVGFRSALHTWRPVIAALLGHALVTGFALPGGQATVSLHRGRAMVATGGSQGDSETGGFVAMLHDRAGNPVSVESGDVLEVQSAGRSVVVPAAPISVQARAHAVKGHTQPGRTVALTVGDPARSSLTRTILTADSAGNFSFDIRHTLAAGTLAVAALVDAAGNQVSAGGFVPGLLVRWGDPRVHGWTVGHGPRLSMLHKQVSLNSQTLHTAPDGSFETELTYRGQPLLPQIGDVAVIGSVQHPRRIHVPHLAAFTRDGSMTARIVGPAGARVEVLFERANGKTDARIVTLENSGIRTFKWPGGAARPGDAVVVRYVAPTGDTVEAASEAWDVLEHAATNVVSGNARIGSTLSIHLLSSAGVQLASGLAAADPHTGHFVASLEDSLGRPVVMRHNMRLQVRDEVDSTTFVLPNAGLRASKGSSVVTARVSAGRRVAVVLVPLHGSSQKLTVRADAHGHVVAPLHGISPATVRVQFQGPSGLVVERELQVGTAQRRPHHSVVSKRQAHIGKKH